MLRVSERLQAHVFTNPFKNSLPAGSGTHPNSKFPRTHARARRLAVLASIALAAISLPFFVIQLWHLSQVQHQDAGITGEASGQLLPPPPLHPARVAARRPELFWENARETMKPSCLDDLLGFGFLDKWQHNVKHFCSPTPVQGSQSENDRRVSSVTCLYRVAWPDSGHIPETLCLAENTLLTKSVVLPKLAAESMYCALGCQLNETDFGWGNGPKTWFTEAFLVLPKSEAQPGVDAVQRLLVGTPGGRRRSLRGSRARGR